jgi:hypothetical protein
VPKPRPIEKRGGYSGSKAKAAVKVPKSTGANVTPKPKS